MMNKTKSAKRQLGRFLFLFPVLAIILLSFRRSFTDASTVNMNADSSILKDTIPDVKILNSKGYYIDIKDDKGNCTVVVKDKDKKEVKRVLLTEWNEKDDYYETLYGEILSPSTAIVADKIKANNPAITAVTVKGNTATVTLKNGKTEVYTLSIKDQKKAFEERCRISEVAIAPTETLIDLNITTDQTAPVPVEERISTTVAEPVNITVSTIAEDIEINDNKAVMKLKNGKTEEYNLADPKEKAAFERKFGKIIKPSAVSTTTGVYSIVSPAQESSPSIATTVSIVPTKEVAIINGGGEIFMADDAKAITIEPDVLLTITQNTTKQELESFKASLKSKGFELTFDEIEYKNDRLVKISGTIKSKEGQASFVGVDFNKIIVSQVTNGEKTYFRIDEVAKKKVVS